MLYIVCVIGNESIPLTENISYKKNNMQRVFEKSNALSFLSFFEGCFNKYGTYSTIFLIFAVKTKICMTILAEKSQR